MHKTLTFALLFSVGMLPICNLYAADPAPPAGGSEEVDWGKECQRVKNLQPPKEDMPAKALLDSAAGCDANLLYDKAKRGGLSTPHPWDSVRACAFSKGDNNVLAMLYANGFGVKQNYDLATKFACDLPDDAQEAVRFIAELKLTGEELEEPFGRCDTGGGTQLELNICYTQRRIHDQKVRSYKLDKISAGWSAEQKKLFAKLREAMVEFSAARGGDETDQRGSGRAVFSGTAEEEVESDFFGDIRQVEGGIFPGYTQDQFESFDNILNENYRFLQRNMVEEEDINGWSSVTKAGIRSTEKSWLKFRDAWVAFGHARYPAIPAHAWKAMLTERRIKDLDDLKATVDMKAVP